MVFTFEGLRMDAVLLNEGLAAGDEARLGGFFKRVDNLVWIKQNSYYKEALEDCKERKKSLGEKLDRREKRVEELTNQIYNVVGFFSVFQGVILTAVTQLTQSTPSPRPLCGKVWFPLVLSLLAAIAAAFGIGLKYKHLNRIDKLIHNERLEQRVVVRESPGKMVRVEVLNGTGEEIIIKEGNAGIYREVQRIRRNGNYDIYVDANATYREFLCVESKSGLTVRLTSDDCIDYEKVTIRKDGARLFWNPEESKDSVRRKTGVITALATDSSIGSWITKLFKKKGTTSSGAPEGGEPSV